MKGDLTSIPPVSQRQLLHGPNELIDTYGLSLDTLAEYKSKVVHFISAQEGVELDSLLSTIREGVELEERLGSEVAKSTTAGEIADTIFMENGRLTAAVRALNKANAWRTNSVIMTVGPTLSLLPSQWKARPIWARGALVTFSPTFLLSSPELVADVMRAIRPASHCTAYIIPSVIEWVNISWGVPP
jgi:hypothetical protein